MARFDSNEIQSLSFISSADGENINATRNGNYIYDYAGTQWRRQGSDSSGNTQVVIAGGSAVIGHVITDAGSVTAATLSAETTKVIGVIRASDGAGNLLTSNSTTPSGKFALDNNIVSILGTAPTTVGKLDIKGADGDVFVRNATAANLNATVVGTGTFAVQEATLDAALIAQEANTSGVKGLTIFGAVTTGVPTYTTAKSDALSLTTAGALRSDITSVAGTAIVNGGVAGSQSVGGTVATNVAITSNPLNLGAQGVSSENAAITTGRQVQLTADLVGKLIVQLYANPENLVSGTITSAMTGTTTTSLVAAPASGLRNYITQITVSCAHATQGTDIIIQDGSGGTTLYTVPASAVYGGATLSFPAPLRQPTTATAIFVANVTTGSSTKASASGWKGA